MTSRVLLILVGSVLVSGCASGISGTVRLVDSQLKPITTENPKGTVVNMINVTAAVEEASASAVTNEKGEFESPKDGIKKGKYKVEASRIGYATQTQEVEVGGMGGKKLEFTLQKYQETKRKAIRGSTSDEDKIVNPGEVNIQPPAM